MNMELPKQNVSRHNNVPNKKEFLERIRREVEKKGVHKKFKHIIEDKKDKKIEVDNSFLKRHVFNKLVDKEKKIEDKKIIEKAEKIIDKTKLSSVSSAYSAGEIEEKLILDSLEREKIGDDLDKGLFSVDKVDRVAEKNGYILENLGSDDIDRKKESPVEGKEDLTKKIEEELNKETEGGFYPKGPEKEQIIQPEKEQPQTRSSESSEDYFSKFSETGHLSDLLEGTKDLFEKYNTNGGGEYSKEQLDNFWFNSLQPKYEKLWPPLAQAQSFSEAREAFDIMMHMKELNNSEEDLKQQNEILESMLAKRFLDKDIKKFSSSEQYKKYKKIKNGITWKDELSDINLAFSSGLWSGVKMVGLTSVAALGWGAWKFVKDMWNMGKTIFTKDLSLTENGFEVKNNDFKTGVDSILGKK